MNEIETTLPLAACARLLCVPVRWLRAEAESGRLPCVRADTTFLFDYELISKLLLERARKWQEPTCAD